MQSIDGNPGGYTFAPATLERIDEDVFVLFTDRDSVPQYILHEVLK